VRVFVALDIPEPVRAAIGALVDGLRAVCPDARWAGTRGAHVTLKFIGEVPPEAIESIQTSLSRVHIPDFIELKFRGLGFFPNERRPRVLWAGIEAGADLGGLAAAVETALEPLGISKEQRIFSPHLTLARFETARQRPGASALDRLRETISRAGAVEFGSGAASQFHLYQSALKRGGSEYTRLATFRFAGGESQ